MFVKARSQLKIEVFCGCDVVSLGKYFPVFQRNIVRSFSGSSSLRRRTKWKGKVR